MTGTGDTVPAAKDAAYANAAQVRAPNLRYRLDIGDALINGELRQLTGKMGLAELHAARAAWRRRSSDNRWSAPCRSARSCMPRRRHRMRCPASECWAVGVVEVPPVVAAQHP